MKSKFKAIEVALLNLSEISVSLTIFGHLRHSISFHFFLALFSLILHSIMSEEDGKVKIVKQPVDILPDEMLMEIFKAMDGKTLKESMLVHPK